MRQYTLESDGQILARARFLARANALYNFGERLAGESDGPLDLLRTQLRWAFVESTG
ncbi:MAG TPA: hypothetical protein VGN32_17300 [Ktedonobacterales bacterium]|nr:hypothetical protein [Ktedonobacterales bacterium]